MDEVELEVGGSLYGGWQDIRVSRSIEAVSGTFAVRVSERWPAQPVARAIGEGERCTVRVAGAVVITGYVDEVRPSYSNDQHHVEISGRDATGDLVDCSSEHVPGEWRRRTIEQIAAELCRPFGISVRAEVSTRAFDVFRLQAGDTVFASIERMARMRAVLAVADGNGGLVFTRAGTAAIPTELVLGGDDGNVLSAEGEFSHRERFSRYVMKGQRAGDDDVHGKDAAAGKAIATDPEVRRYRPLIELAEDQGDGGTLAERARWSASRRAGQSKRATFTVPGWRHSGGIWEPNRLVRVRDSFIAVDSTMLIAGVSFRLSEQGSTTELSLARREAFDLVEIPEKKKRAKASANDELVE